PNSTLLPYTTLFRSQSNWQSPWIFPVPSNLFLLLLDSFSRLPDAPPSLSRLLINSRRGLAAARFILFRRKSSHALGFVVYISDTFICRCRRNIQTSLSVSSFVFVEP